MPKKQTLSNGAAPAAARPKTPRVTIAKHSKASGLSKAQVEQEPVEVEDSSLDSVQSPSPAAMANALPATGNPQQIIAQIAYGYWKARGAQGGSAFEDWMKAEEEFQQRFAS